MPGSRRGSRPAARMSRANPALPPCSSGRRNGLRRATDGPSYRPRIPPRSRDWWKMSDIPSSRPRRQLPRDQSPLPPPSGLSIRTSSSPIPPGPRLRGAATSSRTWARSSGPASFASMGWMAGGGENEAACTAAPSPAAPRAPPACRRPAMVRSRPGPRGPARAHRHGGPVDGKILE